MNQPTCRCFTIFHMKVIQYCTDIPGFVTGGDVLWQCVQFGPGTRKEGFEGLGYKPIRNQNNTIISPVTNAGCFFSYLISEYILSVCQLVI